LFLFHNIVDIILLLNNVVVLVYDDNLNFDDFFHRETLC